MRSCSLVVGLASLLAPQALAQTADPAPSPSTPVAAAAWTGESAISAGYTTGNTQTTDAGLALKAKHVDGAWTEAGAFRADYGQTNGVDSKNHLSAEGQVDRVFSKAWNGYARLTWERDAFSGFDNRYFLGLGLAHKAWETKATALTIEAGPGYKVDQVRAASTLGLKSMAGSTTDRTFGARAGSTFKYAFNDSVALTDASEVVYSETSTQLANNVALTAHLTGNLSARVSLDLRRDTDPPQGFKAADTATKFSFVYQLK